MRLILSLLAVANLRWADAEYARAQWLFDESDRALLRAEKRRRLSRSQAARIGLRA